MKWRTIGIPVSVTYKPDHPTDIYPLANEWLPIVLYLFFCVTSMGKIEMDTVE